MRAVLKFRPPAVSCARIPSPYSLTYNVHTVLTAKAATSSNRAGLVIGTWMALKQRYGMGCVGIHGHLRVKHDVSLECRANGLASPRNAAVWRLLKLLPTSGRHLA